MDRTHTCPEAPPGQAGPQRTSLSGLASTRAQTPLTHHHHDLPPHAPWLHLHLKLPRAGSASKIWSCILLAQVPTMSSAPTFSTFKSSSNTIKYTRVDPAFALPSWLAPCHVLLPSPLLRTPRQKSWPRLQAALGAHLTALPSMQG